VIARYASAGPPRPGCTAGTPGAPDMTLCETERVCDAAPAGAVVETRWLWSGPRSGQVFFVGEQKLFIKGSPMGPFPRAATGAPFPELGTVDVDFALMAEAASHRAGLHCAGRSWLLDAAEQAGFEALGRTSVVATHCVSRQPRDSGADPGSRGRRSTRLSAPPCDLRVSNRQ